MKRILLALLTILFAGKYCPAGSITIIKTGASFSDLRAGGEEYSLEDSDYAANGGILLGDWGDVSKPCYDFYLPPATIGSNSISSISVRLYGKPGTFGSITYIYVGTDPASHADAIGSGEGWHTVASYSGINAQNLVESSGDTIGSLLKIKIDVIDYDDKFDLKCVEVTYEYSGVDSDILDYFQEAYSGYLFIKDYGDSVNGYWNNSALGEDKFWEGIQHTLSFCENLLGLGGNILQATKSFIEALKDLFGITDLFAEVLDYFEFDTNYMALDADDIISACNSSTGDLETLANNWKNLAFDSIADSEASTLSANIDDALTSLNDLESTLHNAVFGGLQGLDDLYQTRGSGDPGEGTGDIKSEMLLNSLSPLMWYDYGIGVSPVLKSESFLPRLINSISDQSNTFVTVTLNTSPAGKGLEIIVDGIQYTNSHTFIWLSGSSHTIVAPSTQIGNDSQEYNFQYWSDGGTRNHNVSPTSDITITATYSAGGDITLEPSDDTFASENSPSSNYGTSSILLIDRWTLGQHTHGFVKFNLSDIPPQSSIDYVELKLSVATYFPPDYAHLIGLYHPISSWSESTLTWNNMPIYNDWQDTYIVDYVQQNSGEIWTWNSDQYPQLIDLVQDWLDHTNTNYGINVRCSINQPGISIYSKEDFENNRHPKLTVNYMEPSGSLTVTINPVEIQSSARWRLTTGPDTGWKQSGQTISNLDLGDYTLKFNEVSGWEEPDDRTVKIYEGSNSESGTYIQLGSLIVNIYPVEVRGTARCRLLTGPDTGWKQSGDTINNITPGGYTLQFNVISGWKRPQERVIIIREGSNSESGTYFEYVYFADATLKNAVEEALGITDPTTADMLLLTYLDAWERGITDLTGLGYAVNLTYLYLNDNQLSSLPPEIGNLTRLKYLWLHSNQLISLPPEIGNLSGLENLVLGDNHLSSLPPEIGNLTSLIILQLNENQLSSLPPEIGNLINLEDLFLYSNQLSSLPPEIGNLITLAGLLLDDNQLSSLPPEIGNLTNLLGLYLFDNQFSSLPPEIGNLTNLMGLYLGDNQFSSLPPEIWNLKNLKYLSLRNNQFSSLPPEIGNLTNLTYLYLHDNQLSSLPPEIWNLTSLWYLNLNSNKLSYLPPEIGNLSRLKSLWLYSNQLSSLPPEFGNLNNLTKLYLHSNPLNTAAYCIVLTLVQANNPGIDLRVDPNPNPLTDDCSTDLSELMAFASHWLATDCGTPNNWCGGVDLNHYDDVNISDFGEFARYWLAETDP